jgi:hypothetical protein
MTLQKEFYANFIVQRLTLKVINMDTLYLVFKDRFPISLNPDLVASRFISVALQATFSRLKQIVILTESRLPVKRAAHIREFCFQG